MDRTEVNHGLAMAASSEDLLQAHETSLWRDQLLHRLAGHSLPPSSLGDRGGWDRFMPSVPRSSSPVKILSRSVERLGKRSNKLGKAHLVAPVLLFILALRLQGLDFLPAFFGFLLYKPAILLIAFSDLTGSNEPKIFVSGSPSA
ncbi:hypothetical protein BV61_05630 [Candidatus Synechococcus spongiarum LMB bulk15M]|uniref:Uncharacterized protein n=1 Tax=Candidatus Synechococcus spongiarum LMB bulk15M TaxID=1943582 RepID=A0A1T1CN95_9SYNE|nr:hypothetical protein BV61_05630 [Candidatus Synechococcus spongiarum LMB bulk15M]